MASYLILISSAPDTKNSKRALSLAESVKEDGNSITLFFVQDGVRAAVNKGASMLNNLISSGAMCYVLDEDLKMRGYEKALLMPKVEPAGYNELVELMGTEGVSTLGAF